MNINQIQVNNLVCAERPPQIDCISEFEWFASTWLCSTLRVFSIKTWEEEDINSLVAYALISDSYPASYLCHEWLPDYEYISINEEEVKSYIKAAKSDIEQAKEDSDYSEDVFLPIDESKIKNINNAYRLQWKGQDPKYRYKYKKYLAKYETGPTNILFWKHDKDFHLLEIHNES